MEVCSPRIDVRSVKSNKCDSINFGFQNLLKMRQRRKVYFFNFFSNLKRGTLIIAHTHRHFHAEKRVHAKPYLATYLLYLYLYVRIRHGEYTIYHHTYNMRCWIFYDDDGAYDGKKKGKCDELGRCGMQT